MVCSEMRIRAVELSGPNLPEELERPLDRGRVGFLTGGQQGQGDQAGRAGASAASTSGQEPSARCRSLRNRTPSRMACSTSSLVTPARAVARSAEWHAQDRQGNQADPAPGLCGAEHG